LIEDLATLRPKRERLRQSLGDHGERFAVRQSVAERINAALSPAIRVRLIQFGNPETLPPAARGNAQEPRVRHLIVAEKLSNTSGRGAGVRHPERVTRRP